MTAVTTIAFGFVLPLASAGASNHRTYPLGSATGCKAHYVERILTHKAKGKTVHYIACVYVAPKAPTSNTVAKGPLISALMGGNGKPNVRPGNPGKVSIVLQGPIIAEGSNDPSAGSYVPVVVENDTNGPINDVDVSGPASVSGTVVGSGDSQGFYPTGNIAPGQLTFGFVFFEAALPANATLTLAPSYHPGRSSYFIDTKVLQANPNSAGFGGGAIVGSVVNTSGALVNGPIETFAMCFDVNGNPTGTADGFVAGNAGLANEATGSYEIDLQPNVSCPTYLVGSSGFGTQ